MSKAGNNNTATDINKHAVGLDEETSF